MLDFIQVKSSTIDLVKHDSTSNQLLVAFKSGGLYKYADVTLVEFQAFLKAESLGSHFARHIKPSKKCSKIEEP